MIPDWARSETVLTIDKFRQGQSLWPPDESIFPGIYSTEEIPTDDKMVVGHWFAASADWWAVELDIASEEAGLAFGFVCLGDARDAEWGSFHLRELAEARINLKLTASDRDRTIHIPVSVVVERDEYWTPVKVADCEGIQRVLRAR